MERQRWKNPDFPPPPSPSAHRPCTARRGRHDDTLVKYNPQSAQKRATSHLPQPGLYGTSGHACMPAETTVRNNFGFPQVKYTHATGGNSNQDRSSVPTMLIVWQSLLTYSCFSCVNVVNGMETRSDFDQQCL
ncbi:hypothetical protein Bbelb_440520 [Branchiostoma belcheri]|nr:hypothetical protein Bbelb_440520 [Branchiostoma belcheri]